MPPQEVNRVSGFCFSVNFKPPRRLRVPTPPSLRASQLPPPCAELDERPSLRVRRFVLWSQKVPSLRLAVLDPRRQGRQKKSLDFEAVRGPERAETVSAHLKRFQCFATPSNPFFLRGDRSVSIDRGLAAQSDDAALTQQGREDSGSITPYPSPSPTPAVLCPPGLSHLPPPCLSPIPQLIALPAPAARTPRKVKSTPQSRQRERASAMQHRLVLSREEERRWRLAMRILMADMGSFVQAFRWVTLQSRSGDCAYTPDSVHEPGQKRPTWFSTVSIDRIKNFIQVMKDIRAASKNVWKHLADAAPRMGLQVDQVPVPVLGMKEARDKVRKMEDKAERKRQKKAEKALAEAQAQADAQTTAAAAATAAAIGGHQSDTGVGHPRQALSPIRAPTNERGRQSGTKPISTAAPPGHLLSSTSAMVAAESKDRVETKAVHSDSSSSDPDRIITPPPSSHAHSHSHSGPDRADSHPQLKRSTGGASSSLNKDGSVPDVIARQLADMLGTFQRLRFAHKRTSSEGSSSTSSIPGIRVVPTKSSTASDGLVAGSLHRGQGLDVESVDSRGSRDDDGDRSVDAMTWATGELNVDDDTNALWSGGGTDVPTSP